MGLTSNYQVNLVTGCWIYQGKLNDSGYPRSHGTLVHRKFYEYYKGPIPKGYIVMHKCDNRACINPEHLSVGTHKENYADALKKNRIRTKLTNTQVMEILESRLPQIRLAEKYGVSKALISLIKRGVRKPHSGV